MPQVKVWNENTHPFEQKFKDMDIKIAAKAFILMDEDDAYNFKGTYAPPKYNADGKDLPEGYKMIRIEHGTDLGKLETPSASKQADANVCMACRYQAANPKDLEEHSKTHASQSLKDEQAEAELKRRGGKAS